MGPGGTERSGVAAHGAAPAARGLLLAGLAALAACHRAPAPPPPPVGPTIVASEGLAADREVTRAFLATRPRYERPLAEGLRLPEGLDSLSAATCAGCHPEIAAEWRVSVHAQAWRDPQYQAEIGKSGNRWLCQNCHTPLLAQQDLWPRGLVEGDVERPVLAPNPAFDAALREEGITCAACHLREDGGAVAIAGPGLGGEAPHAVVVDPDLRSGRLCERCHDAQATYAGKTFICTFWSGHELREGPWDDEGATCVSCHMPAVERAVAREGPARTVAQHWWRGAGIPKFEGEYPPIEANGPGLGLGAVWSGETLEVTAVNARAGHMLPTGDPERWIQVDTIFYAGEAPLGEASSTRFGQRWEWTAPPRQLEDTRLHPRESRAWSIPAPAAATRAVVVATSHRISEEAAAYHHLDGYPRSVETHRLDVAR